MLAKDDVQRSIESDINKIDQEFRATAGKLKEADKKIGGFETDNAKRGESVNTTNSERKHVRFADELGHK